MVTTICLVASSMVAILEGPMVRLRVRSVSPYIQPPTWAGTVVTVRARSAAALSGGGLSKITEMGCPTPTCPRSGGGSNEGKMTPAGATVVNEDELLVVRPAVSLAVAATR